MFIKKFYYTFLLSVLMVAIYKIEIFAQNEYWGYLNFDIDFIYFCKVFFLSFIVAALQPRKINKPSDFFYTIYPILVLLPFGVLSGIYLKESVISFYVFLVLLIPVVFLSFMNFLFKRLVIRTKFNVSLTSFAFFLILCVIFTLIQTWSNKPSTSGFEFSYDRRLEARHLFSVGSVSAYLNGIVLNGISSYLAFWAGYKKKWEYLVFSLFIVVFYFYILGTKAPLLFVIISVLLGYYISMDKYKNFNYFFNILLISVLVIALLEVMFFKYSFISDYVLRRTFTVPPFLMGVYGELFFSGQYNWDFLLGIDNLQGVTFYVGEELLGYDGLNANTNTFIFSLGQGGFLLFSVHLLLFSVVLIIIDSCYRHNQSGVALFLSLIFTILVIEQAVTTALLSSGFALLLCSLLCLEKQG